MRILRFLLYFLLLAYLGALVVISVSSHQGKGMGLKIPLIKGRSIQWEFKVKEIEARRPKYIASARRLFVDSSGKTFLNDNVLIEIPSPRTVIRAEKCIVYPGKSRVEFPETVEVKSETGTFKGRKSLYLARKEVIRLEGGIEFKIGSIEGRAKRGRMDLGENQTLLLEPEFSSGGIVLQGNRVLVKEREMLAYLRGKPATMKSEERTLMAPLMEIDIREKKVNTVSAPRGGWVLEKERRLVAKQLKLWASGEMEGQQVVGRWGKMRFSAARVRGKGDEISAEKASVSQEDLSFKSSHLQVREDFLEATGEVKGKLGEAAFSCQKLSSFQGKRSLFGDVRIVKDGNIINAREAVEEGGNYILREATIITPEGYKLSASQIIYGQDSIVLEGGARLSGENFQISAPRIDIMLKGGKLDRLEARSPRKILLGEDSALSEAISYDFAREQAVLKGKVVLNSRKHGKITGEKITVNPKTGSFEIQGRGRTSSEIKR